MLSDNLAAPASVSRDPHPVYAIRIGKGCDGSKTGVLAYAQEHAREWVPPLVTIETAERLLRNYATHGPTKQLVNNLDIWIVPSVPRWWPFVLRLRQPAQEHDAPL
ncbi:M14 family zinc carboxypeptidase [Ornithinibacter aureus]|nr:M14 family zinc carboxypeptidase [Ornithinibacter aureus]